MSKRKNTVSKSTFSLIIFAPSLFFLIIIGLYLTGKINFLDRHPRTQNSSDIKSNQRENRQTSREDDKVIKEFESKLLDRYPDLRNRLENEEIQSAFKLVLNKPPQVNTMPQIHDEIWVLESIDKFYLNNTLINISVTPRHQYLITSLYWKELGGPYIVECLLDKPLLTKTSYSPTEPINIVILRNQNCPSSVSLNKYSTGETVPFSDPNDLIPLDQSWIMTTDGRVGGSYINFVYAEKLLIEVSYGHAETYAHAYFDAKTGELTHLVIF